MGGIFYIQAQLKLAEKRSSQPSAELIQLQGEVQRLKVSGSELLHNIYEHY